MKFIILTLFALLAVNPSFAKGKDYKNLIESIHQKIDARKLKAKSAAQILKFTVSPENPKVKENVTVFVQPLTNFVGSDTVINLKMDGAAVTSPDFEHPTNDLWVYNAKSFTEVKAHTVEATISIRDTASAQTILAAIADLDSQIAALNTQIASETDPQIIAQLTAQRDDKIAQKNNLLQTLADLNTEIATENIIFQIKEDLTQPDYPVITSVSPNVIRQNTATGIRINGSQFVSGVNVKIGGQVATINNQTTTALDILTSNLSNGLYDVEVFYTDNGQIKNAVFKNGLMVANEAGNPYTLPTAVINANNTVLQLGDQVQLWSGNSYDSSYRSLRYEWKFVSIPENTNQQITTWPINNTMNFNFTPNVPGFYVVQLNAIQNEAPYSYSQPTYVAIEIKAPANRAPVVQSANLSVLISQTTSLQLNVNDPDFWQAHSFYITQNPILGTATITESGELQYQAGANAGTDSVGILVVDNGSPAKSTQVTVPVNILATNQSPLITSVYTQNRTQGLPVRSVIAPQGLSDPDGSIVEIKIDCGDGMIEYAPVSGPNLGVVLHNYHAYGTYNGVVYIKDNLGAVTTYNFTNNVLNTDIPNVKFSLNQISCPAAPCVITANASVTTDSNGIGQYRWLWGDNTSEQSGSSNAYKIRSHTYNNNGVYRIRLRVRDVNQAQNEGYAYVYVGVNPPATGSPAWGNFVTTPTREVTINTDITFDGLFSFDPNPNGSITNTWWNMNCWPTNSCTAPNNGISFIGQYQTTYNFYPEIKVTNSLGGETSYWPLEVFAVTQGHAPRPIIKVNNQVLLGTDVIGTAPLTVNLDATNSFDYDGTIQWYGWEFGDGTTDYNSNKQKVKKTFTSPGIYYVRFTIKDNDQNYVNVSQKIIVNAANVKTKSGVQFKPSLDLPEENLTNACGSGVKKACEVLKKRYQVK